MRGLTHSAPFRIWDVAAHLCADEEQSCRLPVRFFATTFVAQGEIGTVGVLVEAVPRRCRRGGSTPRLRDAWLFFGLGDSQVGSRRASLCELEAAGFNEPEQRPGRIDGVQARDTRTVRGVCARVHKVAAVLVHGRRHRFVLVPQ